jgi:hypothetical protein
VSLRSETVKAIARDGYGREAHAASELIGCVAALSRDMEADDRSVVALALLRLAAELDAAIQLRPVH